ncbi:MAG: xanthine dehydrogenase family protein molybdopterin-binding subunit [Actinomycetia bacterium]|nr:xanthine dehydrogenase family protein molybdopterin-binding subunit [Actinomycetes bacterium]
MTDPVPLTGQPIRRLEDERLVTGRATFVADLDDPRLVDRAHVVFVRSPLAHAEITGVDLDRARTAAGSLGVFSAAQVDVFPAGRFAPSLHPGFAQPCLAEKRVRYVGEPVVAVVAETMEAAVDIAELVDVSYERLEPVLDLATAGTNPVILFEPGTEARLQADVDRTDEASLGDNVAVDTGWCGSSPSTPSPFDQAAVSVELQVMNPRMSPAPIEPRAVLAAWVSDGDRPSSDTADADMADHDRTASDELRLLVWIASQRPHGYRNELCALYQLSPDRVSVVAGPDVGGGFGGKTSRSPEERIIPFLARAVGRPVSWIETRSEYLAGAPHGRGEQINYLLSGTREGKITGLRAELIKDAGAYPMTGAIIPAGYTVPCANGAYDIDHVEVRAVSVATNRVPTSAYRGAGRAPYLAGLERLVDLFATRIGLDPAEARRRNLIRPDQLPYLTPTGARYDEADYPGDLEQAIAVVGLDQLRAKQAERRASSQTCQMGIGVATYCYITVGGGGEEASVTLLDDGRARVVTGTTSQGHGHVTTWAQLAADVLAMPIESIVVVEGDSDAIGSGVGAVGSRSAQTAGMAIHRAATELVSEAMLLAADILEAAVDDLVLDRSTGSFHVIGTPARSLSWGDVAVVALDEARELSCGDFYDTNGANTYPSGTHVAVVEVDTETGGVDLVRFVAVDDAGVRINPLIVDGQLHGGIAAGISQALGEEVLYDDAGNLVNTTFLDYTVATTDQLPSFELTASQHATSVNPLGIKGVGESGTIGSTPAVHNAIVDAISHLGVEHMDLPCTPERIWTAIERARGRR